ncbi:MULTISPECIES: hypothetical protein [Ralstonia]|nr:hypothetical protein [Ralstonia pickettii]
MPLRTIGTTTIARKEKVSTTAWAILKQDLRMTDCEAKVLTAVLTGNPVALQGHEALIPLSDLVPYRQPALTGLGEQKRNVSVKRDIQLLFEVLMKNWIIALPDGTVQGFHFVSEYALMADSQFLRFRLNRFVLVLLEQIRSSRELRDLF